MRTWETFLKEWDNIEGFNGVDEVINRVTNVFAGWEKKNLTITHGRRENRTSYTYGLPYTSSGCFASLGCYCQVEAHLNSEPDFVIYELAINNNREIVAYLTDADENEKYIVIGIL